MNKNITESIWANEVVLNNIWTQQKVCNWNKRLIFMGFEAHLARNSHSVSCHFDFCNILTKETICIEMIKIMKTSKAKPSFKIILIVERLPITADDV